MTVITPVEVQGTQVALAPTRSPRARIAWTLGGLLLAVAIVPALALSIVGSTAYQRLNSGERLFTSPVTAVTVEVSSGDITIEHGDGGNTRVETSGVHGLTYPTDNEHVVGHTLVIRSSCGATLFNDRCSRSYVLHVPSGVAVTADSSQGNVDVSDGGRVSAHSDEGDVTITRGSGTLQASSGQGDVTISRSTARSVSAHSGQGDVVVDLVASPKRLIASSGQGNVAVELPTGPNSYQVHANSGQGNVSDNVDNNPASNRVVEASSGQGDVTVGYRAG
jgi:hypothetical protein